MRNKYDLNDNNVVDRIVKKPHFSFKNSYWLNNGKHQQDWNRIFKKLVPAKGPVKNQFGELVRLVAIMYNKYHNDGQPFMKSFHRYLGIEKKATLKNDIVEEKQKNEKKIQVEIRTRRYDHQYCKRISRVGG